MDNGNRRRTDSLSSRESRLSGDEGRRGNLKERINRMCRVYVPDK